MLHEFLGDKHVGYRVANGRRCEPPPNEAHNPFRIIIVLCSDLVFSQHEALCVKLLW